MSYLLSYGESWYEYKQALNSDDYKFDDIPSKPISQPRMKRREANEFYTKRSREVFTALGMIKEVKKPEVKHDYIKFIDFEDRLPKEFKRVRNATRQMISRERKRLRAVGYFKEVA